MGRKRNIYVRDFFIIEGNRAKCKACEAEVSAMAITNLKRHLQTKHNEMLNVEEKRFKTENCESEESAKKIKFSVEMSVNEVTDACISYITKESLPLSFFDSDSFRVLTNPIFDGLKMPKIHSRNIMNFVHEKYDKIKKNILKITGNKILCLKIDTATRLGRAVLGINLQLIERNKIEIITLAMIELKTKHTADNLKNEIVNVLNSFNIETKQIYAITTDNGRNMVKTVELLSENSDNEENDSENDDHYQNLLESITLENILSIRCAAHTLQLAVKDFLEKLNSNVIDKSRRMVKTLRTPAYRYRICNSKLLKAQVDVPTRWSSTYHMLKRLLDLKDFCIEHLSALEQLPINEWAELEEIVKALGPVNDLTLKLQKSSLLLGDFYKFWLELIFQLKDLDTTMGRQILEHVENRQTTLLENDTIYAALYLDPRFKRVLSLEKIQAAKKHLKKLVLQIYNLENNKTQPLPSKNIEESSFLIDEDSMASSSSLLRKGLRDMEVNNSSSDDDDAAADDSIRKAYMEIDTYKEKRLDISADLLEYWDSKKFTLPWLRILALILHSVPATQVSVERSFSALRLILGDLRYNLSEANLQSIMMVKLNSCKSSSDAG